MQLFSTNVVPVLLTFKYIEGFMKYFCQHIKLTSKFECGHCVKNEFSAFQRNSTSLLKVENQNEFEKKQKGFFRLVIIDILICMKY